MASLVGGVQKELQKELAQIWVTLRLLNRYLGDVETSIINFSMKEARDHAWSVAQRVAPLDDTAQEAEIAQLDSEVLRLIYPYLPILFGIRAWSGAWSRRPSGPGNGVRFHT